MASITHGDYLPTPQEAVRQSESAAEIADAADHHLQRYTWTYLGTVETPPYKPIHLYCLKTAYMGFFYHPVLMTHYRAYNPSIGRWLSMDPMGYVDGQNLYNYCGGSPTNFTDPLGDETLVAFKSRIDSFREVHKGKAMPIDYWIEVIKGNVEKGDNRYQSIGIDGTKNRGNQKHMVTEVIGAFDIEHFLNFTRDSYKFSRSAHSKFSNNPQKADEEFNQNIKSSLFKEDDGERNGVGWTVTGLGKTVGGYGGKYPDIEDPSSNYLGYKMGLFLYGKFGDKKATYAEVADSIFSVIQSFKPLKTEEEEQAFIGFFKGDGIGLGDIFHKMLDYNKADGAILKCDYYNKEMRANLTIRGSLPGQKGYSDIKLNYINLMPIINYTRTH